MLPGNETLATDDRCLSGACPSNSPEDRCFDDPFVYGWEKPLLFTSPVLCPFDGPAEEGPASG